MHGNQWVLKIAVLKYYSVSKRGTTAKSNPKQATDPISLHTKFGDNSSNTFPLNERKPCVTPDIGRRTPDNGQRTSDGEKSKNNISTPQGGGHNNLLLLSWYKSYIKFINQIGLQSLSVWHGFEMAKPVYFDFQVTSKPDLGFVCPCGLFGHFETVNGLKMPSTILTSNK